MGSWYISTYALAEAGDDINEAVRLLDRTTRQGVLKSTEGARKEDSREKIEFWPTSHVMVGLDRLFLSRFVTSQLERYSSKSRCDMNKFVIMGMAVMGVLGTVQPSEAKPVGTDRYRVEFTGEEGKRFTGTVFWSGPGGREAKQQNQQIKRQLPLAFEIDLPHGSSLMADGSVGGQDRISVKIFLNGFRCDDARKESPSSQVWKTCLP